MIDAPSLVFPNGREATPIMDESILEQAIKAGTITVIDHNTYYYVHTDIGVACYLKRRFEVIEEKSACECGALKTYNAPAGPLHSTWCPEHRAVISAATGEEDLVAKVRAHQKTPNHPKYINFYSKIFNSTAFVPPKPSKP